MHYQVLALFRFLTFNKKGNANNNATRGLH